jgi:hypothetical protein
MEQPRQHDLKVVLDDARSALRTRRRFRVLALVLPVAVALSALLVGISRFTLSGLPEWFALVPIAAALPLAWLLAGVKGVSTSDAARYLDSAWGLDQRLSTLTQLQRRRAYSTARQSNVIPLRLLASDTLHTMQKSARAIPWVPSFKLSRTQFAALFASFSLLLFALFASSPADSVRADIAATEQALATQLQELAELRAEVERIGLPQNLKSAILDELDTLESALRSAGPDRSALLAALGDAQSRIGNLTPERVSQWGEIIRAARALQDMGRRAIGWEPPPVDDLTDLSSGALAAESIAASMNRVSLASQADMAQELDSLARLVEAKSRSLSTAFEEGSVSLYSRNGSRAAAAFLAMGEELRRLEKRELSAEAIEKALAKLEDGKQDLLAGQAPTKKTQVGFNRGDRKAGQGPGTTPSSAGTGADAAPGLGEGGTPTDPLRSGPGGVPGASIGDGATDQQGQPGDAGGTDGGSDDLPRAGTKTGQTGTSEGGSAQADSGTQGAPIEGNPGSLTGGITKVENPSGQGLPVGENQSGDTSGQDRVYVPQALPGGSDGGQQPGQTQPEGGISPVLPGIADDGASDRTGGNSGGKVTEVRTPYKEVLRDYAQRATEALDNTFIPPDARQLVRNYFTGLGQ